MVYALMGPAVVIVIHIFTQNLPKMIFTKDKEMIQAFSTNRANTSFDKSVGFRSTIKAFVRVEFQDSL